MLPRSFITCKKKNISVIDLTIIWLKKFQVFYEACGFICENTTEAINWLSIDCIRSATEVFCVVLLLAFGPWQWYGRVQPIELWDFIGSL